MNRQRKYNIHKLLFAVLMAGWICGCHLPYEADVDEKIGVLTVEGSLVKGDSLQTVVISRSTSMTAPYFNGVRGCIVTAEDEFGEVFSFEEDEDGIYNCVIPDDKLVHGREYRIRIITSDGEEYESTYEELIRGAPVDSVYYERKQVYDEINDEELDGVQFYLDLVGSEDVSRFYRWTMSETWEYQSISFFDFIHYGPDGPLVLNEDPFEFFFCWKSSSIPGHYSSSTVNLTSNEKRKIPLHYVSNKTDRLRVRYSILIRQYSLTESAYNYWNRIKIEMEELNGLYTQQPGQLQSNIMNVNNEQEKVLGYFWVSSLATKRIFTDRPDGLTVYRPYCELELVDTLAIEYPLYGIITNPWDSVIHTSEHDCLDCRMRGGTNIMPEYWE